MCECFNFVFEVKSMARKNLVFILIFTIFIVACNEKIPTFDQNNAFKFLEEQCELGPRYPGSEGIELCRDYLVTNLKKYTNNVTLREFKAEVNKQQYTGKNIIAKFYPRMSRRILLAAHYDTRPWADKEENKEFWSKPIIGANDGASGVAVLLEIARIIAQKQPQQFGIDMVLFDMEDMGKYNESESWCLGSRYFAKNYQGTPPEKSIIVDMIGDKDLELKLEKFSYDNSPELVNEIWNIARENNYKEFKYQISQYIIDDHYPLIQKGFEAIVIIDFDYKYWHTLEDTIDKCSPHSLGVVGNTLLQLIYKKQ